MITISRWGIKYIINYYWLFYKNILQLIPDVITSNSISRRWKRQYHIFFFESVQFINILNEDFLCHYHKSLWEQVPIASMKKEINTAVIEWITIFTNSQLHFYLQRILKPTREDYYEYSLSFVSISIKNNNEIFIIYRGLRIHLCFHNRNECYEILFFRFLNNKIAFQKYSSEIFALLLIFTSSLMRDRQMRVAYDIIISFHSADTEYNAEDHPLRFRFRVQSFRYLHLILLSWFDFFQTVVLPLVDQLNHHCNLHQFSLLFGCEHQFQCVNKKKEHIRWKPFLD